MWQKWTSRAVILSFFVLLIGNVFFDDLMIRWLTLLGGTLLLVGFINAAHRREQYYIDESKRQMQIQAAIIDERQLRDLQLDALIDNFPDAICYVNQHGKIVIRNRSFVILSEVDESVLDITDRRINLDVRSIFNHFRLSGSNHTITHTIEGIDYRISFTPIVNFNRLNGALYIFQDVSTLLEGERMQKRFLADASHELKTPIMGILGMSEIMLRKDFNDPETGREFLIQIDKEARRLQLLVSDLTMVSRLASKQTVVENSPFVVRQCLETIENSFKSRFHAKNIVFEIQGDPDLILNSDIQKWYVILNNLVENALFYTNEGKVIINYRKIKGIFQLSIQDTGIGISNDDLLHIFDRFYRSSRSRQRNTGGSGIGLSIVKSIVETLDGEITCTSVLGEGSCFLIKLTET